MRARGRSPLAPIFRPLKRVGATSTAGSQGAGQSFTAEPEISAHGHASTEPTVTATAEVAPADAVHGHASTEPTVTASAAATAAPADAVHAHASTQPTLTAETTVAPADSTHAHASTQPDVGALFDPIDGLSGSWEHAYWAEGSNFAAEGYADTDTVDPWPDEVGSSDLAAGNAPTYDASGSSFNSQPVVVFDGSDYLVPASNLPTDCHQMVAVVKLDASGTNRWHDTQASGGRWVMGVFGANWQIFFGSNAGQTVAGDTGAHLVNARQNASSDYLEIDGSNIYPLADRGGAVIRRPNVGNNGNHNNFTLAFLGIWDSATNGDVTDDANWSDFTAWVDAHYGITQP